MVFEVWLRSELPALLRFADALCGSRTLAEEIVQDVALKVHRRWSRIGPLPHREAYVRRMIINEFLSWRRKWSRMVPQADLLDQRRDTGPDLAEEHADRAELVAELARLPRKQRAVVVLRYVEGLPDAEIGRLLGCAETTVRSHASRALATLRVTLQPTTETNEESHAHRG
jgi:RNA polymerase sigma-70 factor (sigma-E family)